MREWLLESEGKVWFWVGGAIPILGLLFLGSGAVQIPCGAPVPVLTLNPAMLLFQAPLALIAFLLGGGFALFVYSVASARAWQRRNNITATIVLSVHALAWTPLIVSLKQAPCFGPQEPVYERTNGVLRRMR